MDLKPSLPFSVLARTLKTDTIYEHYKGQLYKVIYLARHSETREELVVYQALYGEKGIWVRPLSMFLERLNIEGKYVQRFMPKIDL